jgi:RimJ/RimL family protein N-acetyltransferase
MKEPEKKTYPQPELPCVSYFKGKRLSLIPFEREDIPLVAGWNNLEEISAFSETRFPVSIFEQTEWYEKTMRDKSKNKLIVRLDETNEKIGLVSLFKIDQKNLNCMIGAYIAPEYQNHGYVKEALSMIIRFAFQELNMHRIYGHVIDFPGKILKVDAAVGITYECTLKEAMYTNGRFFDVHVIALLREVWEKDFKDKW